MVRNITYVDSQAAPSLIITCATAVTQYFLANGQSRTDKRPRLICVGFGSKFKVIKRLQAPVKNKVVGDCIWEALVKRKIVDPDVHRRGGVTCLKSLPGCEEQHYHYDYDPEVLRHMVKKTMGVLLVKHTM